VKPYYQDNAVTIYHGDSREFTPPPGTLVTDPPYGIDYKSGYDSTLPRSIAGDKGPGLRDAILLAWGDQPALVFGTWRIPRSVGVRILLIWDTKGALGMGNLSLPWKPSHQEIYVLGGKFHGPRTSDVLTYAPVQSMARNGRVHPHQKPVDLMKDLILKCPVGGVIYDPFMGSGSTLRAAKDLGRQAIGVEIDEAYCETAAKRMAQEVIAL
jgi:DNA modification methylase